MDSRPQDKADVSGKVAEIKEHMPAVYNAIQAKAGEVGNVAYEWVRKALRGEPGCFWAIEGGRVVGTPFYGHPVMDVVAKGLVEFGCAYVCIWPDQQPAMGLQRNTGAAQHGQA